MSSGPDLFVVCKQCGSEVSPYITECPYCGSRLRSRAPKLPRVKSRGGVLRRLGRALTFGRSPLASARASGTLVAARRLCAWGIAPVRDDRPGCARLRRLGGCLRGGYVELRQARDRRPPARRLVEAAHQPVRLRERAVRVRRAARYARSSAGCWSAGAGRRSCSRCSSGASVTGALAAIAVYAEPIVSGANAGALALIAAWSIPDLRAARRGYYYDGDLLGAGAIAALLLVLPYARPEASWLAGVVGAVVGLIVGLGLELIDSPEP